MGKREKSKETPMKRHRVRPTALIFRNDNVLLIEYEEDGKTHYNLPGGGLKKGEMLIDGLIREVEEEACVTVQAGGIAFVYEFNPLKQSGDYEPDTRPSLNIIFECRIEEDQEPKLPSVPDPLQVGVRWVPVDALPSIVLYPNIADHILSYYREKISVPLVEDFKLSSYKNDL